MPVYETFSSRKKRAVQKAPDVYQYSEIPAKVRNQVSMILNAALGPWVHDPNRFSTQNNECWDFIRDALRREKGLSSLVRNADNAKMECLGYLASTPEIDDCLDLIEIAFKIINTYVRDQSEYARKEMGITQDPDDAIKELNIRLLDGGVGYQFESNEIIRTDSQLMHSEVMRPALQLLSDDRFKGAEQEFLATHGHYRVGEHKDAVTDANNAFESTLKTICELKGWPVDKKPRASDLLKVVRKHGLFPDYLDNSFDQLAATLASGLPQVRNEAGSHGQGSKPKETPGYVASYALHLAAAKIVLLVEAFKAGERLDG